MADGVAVGASAEAWARPTETRRRPLDLRPFPARTQPPLGRWRHVIRTLDGRGRVHVPEAAKLGDGGPGALTAILRSDRWELRPAPPRLGGFVDLDPRRRVLIPLGVRHQLGLEHSVLVSVALDFNRLVVWPASRRDELLEDR